MRTFWVSGRAAGIAALIATAFAWPGCGRPAGAGPGAAPLARPVAVAPVETVRVAPEVLAPGVLVRRLEATLSFKVAGVIETVAVRPGASVRAGDELARLQLAEIEAAVSRARSALVKARRDVERTGRLRAEAVITAEEAENAVTALELAEADLRTAEFNRRHAVIVAPADGWILRRRAEPGELVGPGQPVLEFGSDVDGWIVRVQVPEREARRLMPGGVARIEFGGRPAEVLSGRIERLAEAASAGTGTIEIEVEVSPPAGSGLRSGAVGLARLVPVEAEYTAVPVSALLAGEGRAASVLVLDAEEHTVRRVPVEVAALVGDRALLAAALPSGTRVVTAGAALVRDGESVRVVLPPGAPQL
jgi:multidrug efflux system membrane fusion protein